MICYGRNPWRFIISYKTRDSWQETALVGERNGWREEREISAKRKRTGDLAKKKKKRKGFFLLLLTCQVLHL